MFKSLLNQKLHKGTPLINPAKLLEQREKTICKLLGFLFFFSFMFLATLGLLFVNMSLLNGSPSGSFLFGGMIMISALPIAFGLNWMLAKKWLFEESIL